MCQKNQSLSVIKVLKHQRHLLKKEKVQLWKHDRLQAVGVKMLTVASVGLGAGKHPLHSDWSLSSWCFWYPASPHGNKDCAVHLSHCG